MSAPVLFVHAHPDDETLATGLALAHHARHGGAHVLTCTLGEQGEVIPPELAHLDADHDDTLGPYRWAELRAAMAVLGATHEVLGADPGAGRLSRWRDSGMAGTPGADHPDAFVGADVGEAGELVADVVRRLAPAAVVTYDRHGGYGHPDHIQAHRVTCAALASLPEDSRPPLYAVLTPSSWAREDRVWLASHPLGGPWSLPDPDGEYPPSVVDDGRVTHELIVPQLRALQAQALRAHRTQVTVATDGLSFALSNDIAARLPGREGYALLDPVTGDLATGAPAGPARPGTRHTGIVGEAR